MTQRFDAAQRGGTIVGFIVGLVVGLGIAVVVALMVTKAPIPFINKVAHGPDQPATEPGKVPDPNKAYYSHDTVPSVETTPGPANTAALNAPTPSAEPGVAAANTPPPEPKVAIIEKSRPDVPEGRPSYLQAGAYRTTDDAENMRAKLALLGFEAAVSPGDRDGNALFRVRLGPYTHVDDLNRVRQRLAENGIDANVVPAVRGAP